MSDENPTSIRAALELAITAGATVTLTVRLESGRTREVQGVPTRFYQGRDGKDRIGLLVGMQTQQAVLVESIVQVEAG